MINARTLFTKDTTFDRIFGGNSYTIKAEYPKGSYALHILVANSCGIYGVFDFWGIKNKSELKISPYETKLYVHLIENRRKNIFKKK